MKTPTIVFFAFFIICSHSLINSLSIKKNDATKSNSLVRLKDILFNLFNEYYFRSVDLNRDGELTKEEWIHANQYLSHHYSIKTPDLSYLESSFDSMNLEDDGEKWVTINELKNYLKKVLLVKDKNKYVLSLVSSITFSIIDRDKSGRTPIINFYDKINGFSKRRKLTSISFQEFTSAFENLSKDAFDGYIYGNDLVNLAEKIFTPN